MDDWCLIVGWCAEGAKGGAVLCMLTVCPHHALIMLSTCSPQRCRRIRMPCYAMLHDMNAVVIPASNDVENCMCRAACHTIRSNI